MFFVGAPVGARGVAVVKGVGVATPSVGFTVTVVGTGRGVAPRRGTVAHGSRKGHGGLGRTRRSGADRSIRAGWASSRCRCMQNLVVGTDWRSTPLHLPRLARPTPKR